MSRRSQHGSPPPWDVAQICLNGHVITDAAQDWPDHCQDYCGDCGAKTITSCPACDTAIRGHLRGTLSIGTIDAPKFCHACGAAYPWTVARLGALQELVEDAEGLSEGERKVLQQSMAEIVRDTPAAAPAAAKLRKLVSKLAPKVGALVWEWSVEVASATAAKVLKP